ncbi:MAG TPA: hypothetical protein DCW47_02230 [Lachnospiraceae bacterium]|nr:hypothetical protein [Lachnospiraceae bacterium]
MVIQEIPGEDSLVLKIQGRIDANFADEFTERITDACGKSSYVKLDLSEAPYFSSAGLRGLIMGQKIEGLKHGKIELYGVNDVLLKILQDTGLDQSLTIYTGGIDSGEPPLNTGRSAGPGIEETKRLNGPGDNTEASPGFLKTLPIAQSTDQIFMVAVQAKTAAWVALHEKDANGSWYMMMSTVGFIGREGLGEKGKKNSTQRGVYGFEKNLLTCTDDRRAFTDGRIAIPRDKLNYLLDHVSENCVCVVDELEALGGSL